MGVLFSSAPSARVYGRFQLGRHCDQFVLELCVNIESALAFRQVGLPW